MEERRAGLLEKKRQTFLLVSEDDDSAQNLVPVYHTTHQSTTNMVPGTHSDVVSSLTLRE